jgi:hypothetical protein
MNRQKILLPFIFLIFGVSFYLHGQLYNDLNDYGYNGKIKSVSTKFYTDIKKSNRGYAIADTLNPARIFTYDFNGDGNFIKKVVEAKPDSFQIFFYYEGKTKTGWKRINNSGLIVETCKIISKRNSGFTENVFDMAGFKNHQSNYIFSKDQKTKTIEAKGYNKTGEITYHSITDFEDDKEGHLYKFTTKNILTKKIDHYEFTITKKDGSNNPVEILVKKNKKTVEIRKVTIKYE